MVRDSDGDGAHAPPLRLRPQVLQVLSAGTHFTRFTGTKVQILTQTAFKGCALALFYSVYSLYWYKSANTDAEGAAGNDYAVAVCVGSVRQRGSALSLSLSLSLYIYIYRPHVGSVRQRRAALKKIKNNLLDHF